MEIKNKKLKLMFEKYQWSITNFSKLDSGEHCSDKFILDDHSWQIAIYPKGNEDDYFAIYLETDPDCDNLPEGWKKTANVNVALINQFNDKMTVREGFEFEFNEGDNSYYGFQEFLALDELNKPGSGFIVNDTCMIEVGIFVTKYLNDNQEYKPLCKIDIKPTQDNSPFFDKIFRSSFETIEQNFVPLLEEACLQHPSLVASQEKRSCRFTEWAFTALGRVLHFLNTKKVKYMDDEACNHLQILWDELKTCGFDLSWLECHVQSALDAQNYMKNAAELRKNVSALKIETEKLKAMLVERETEQEKASRNLVEAEERLEESFWVPNQDKEGTQS